MSTTLQKYEGGGEIEAFRPQQVLEQVQLVQQLMSSVMREGEHYGNIPGCGDKKTLLKPGAEKLLFTFRLAPELEETITDMPGGHREYRVKCTLRSVLSGKQLGQGVGSCSTMEGKWRYRSEATGRQVPAEYWQTRNAELLGGIGYSARKVGGAWMIFHRVEHDNPADYYNTALKMAKKRALVDAVLTATAASDCFTQDVEDIEENLKHYEAEAPPSAPTPTAPRPAPTTQPEPESTPAGDWRGVVIHFGKNKGTPLGALGGKQLAWYQTEWEPKEWNGKFSEADLALRRALNASMNRSDSAGVLTAAADAAIEQEEDNVPM